MNAAELKTTVKELLYKIIPLSTHINIQQRLISRLKQFLPEYAYANFQQELGTVLLNYKSCQGVANQYQNSDELLVNLGAGPHGKPGWINVDICNSSGVNCVYDCRKSFPFSDNSAKGIFTEHFFEHLDYAEEIPQFLSECYRVLKIGGVVRIVVPDVEKYLRAYCQEGWQELSIIRPLDSERRDFHFNCKYDTKIELINAVFRQGYEHKYAYDYETLELLLYRYGFSTVKRQEYGKSLLDELCIDQQIRASESLYVEAVK